MFILSNGEKLGQKLHFVLSWNIKGHLVKCPRDETDFIMTIL